MSRITFKESRTARGSQKWLQRMARTHPERLQPKGLPTLVWLSPLAEDAHAEYMDAEFLARLNLQHLSPALKAFWPRSGPRWDGLATAGDAVVLVEAKAHLREANSSPLAAKATESITMIRTSLATVKTAMGATGNSDWTRSYYQYANRLAHLWWLRSQRVDAHLLLIGFVNDTEMRGPASADPWHKVYRDIDRSLNLPQDHAMTPYIHHVHPDVTDC